MVRASDRKAMSNDCSDKLFPPDIAPGLTQGLKAAGVDADYFLPDSDYGHSASGLDADKWAPRLKQFMDGL
jgi:homoserine O-acetyltransferase/O-succinyltransferase